MFAQRNDADPKFLLLSALGIIVPADHKSAFPSIATVVPVVLYPNLKFVF